MVIHLTSMSSHADGVSAAAATGRALKPAAASSDFQSLFARTAAEESRKIGVSMPTAGKTAASSGAQASTGAGTTSGASSSAAASSGSAATSSSSQSSTSGSGTSASGSSAPTAESVFGANPWETNPGGTGPNGLTYSYNPYYFATPATAQTVANMLGGTVVSTNAILGNSGGPFDQSQPNLMVQLPNGAQVNAGLVAQIYTHGYPQSTINQMIAQIADTPAPVST